MKIEKKQARNITMVSLILLLGAITGMLLIQNRLDLLGTYGFNSGEQNTSYTHHAGNDSFLIGTGQNNILAYNSGGKLLWTFEAKGLIRKVVIRETDGVLLAGSEDRNIYMINPDNGELLGTIPIRGKLYDMDYNRKTGQIAVSSGMSAIKHYISLFDSRGNPLREENIAITSYSIAYLGDRIIYGTNRGEVFLTDSTGREIKKKKLDGQIMDLVSNGSEVACLTERGSLYFFDSELAQTGGLMARGEAKALEILWEENLAMIGMKSGALHLVERNGKERDVLELPLQISGIYADDNDVKVICRDGYLYTLDRKALEHITRYKVFFYLLFTSSIIILVFLLWALFILLPRVKDFLISIASAFYQHKTAYLMLLPIFLLLIIFHYYPVTIAMIRSFTDWSVHSEKISFNGLENFRLMFREGYFFAGIKNLGILTGMEFIKLFTMPLLAAKLVYHMTGVKKATFRLLFVLPMVVPGVVAALVWQNIYDPNIGLLNNLLEVVGLENLQRVWLGSEKTAIWSIVFMKFPFVDAFAFLVYYGGLINIPDELFEASNLDGANGWWNFWKIQVPLLTPQVKMLIILTFIRVIQDFAPILILTGGGPGISTYVPGLELYYNITRFGRYGYASALGLVMFVFIFGGTLLNLKMKTSSENEI